MFPICKTITRTRIPQLVKCVLNHVTFRSFLSPAYYCNEVWEQRLKDSIIEDVNLDVYYNQLDQKYQKTGVLSAIDVDIFANAINDDTHTDELLDLLHKLRLTAETGNTLHSTGHAAIRHLLGTRKIEQLLNILDDRLNYGIFLDHYTANLLLDTFLKEKDYVSGARVASQLMLQEDFQHPINISLSLLHCYNYLLNPMTWPQPIQEEPKEEVKVRVKYLRNPHDDDHFDLKDPFRIVGKTLIMLTKSSTDVVDKSLYLVGLALYRKSEKLKKFIDHLKSNNDIIVEEAIKLIPEENENKKEILSLKMESRDLQKLLEDRVKQAENTTAERDIVDQCDVYSKWLKERKDRLDEQNERYQKVKRIANIEEIQKSLKEREKLLWYFDNEDKIMLEIESKKVYYPKRWFGKKKKPKQVDEGYIPPEVKSAKV